MYFLFSYRPAFSNHPWTIHNGIRTKWRTFAGLSSVSASDIRSSIFDTST